MAPSIASLPSYTTPDSPEIPSYTAQPRGGEQILRQGRLHAAALRDWTVRDGAATLTLADQPVGVRLPIYGRENEVKGNVFLHSTQDVVSVKLRLYGYVKCKTIAEIGSSQLVVLDQHVAVWEATSSSTTCPNILPFKVVLPSESHSSGDPLPPTFEYTYYDVQGGTPGIKAKVKYQIFVEIEHSHSTLKDKLGLGLSTQFVYLPRTRPAVLPALVPSSVFEAAMDHRVGTSKEQNPVVWKLTLPPPGTYPLTKAIPFKITVTSRTSSLITPFAPTNKRDKAAIRVYIMRHVAIRVNSVDLWQSYVIGEGNVRYVPPSLDGLWLRNVMTKVSYKSDNSAESIDEGWARHDWEGEVKVDDSVTVGGFKVSDMTVKDFMVLSVIPPNPRFSDLLEVKRPVPIQLTTDECISDFTMLPPLSPLLQPQPQPQSRAEEREPVQNGNGIYHNGASVNSNGS